MARAKKVKAKKPMSMKKKAARKPVPSKAGKAPKPAARGAGSAGRRLSWLDEASGAPVIDSYARKLSSFMEALADGIVQESELKAQEQRLVKLMKAVEPQLDGALHGQVTELLCELTAYDIMQMLHSMHAARPQTRFRG